MKKFIHGFEDIDVDATLEKIEKVAERLDSFWMELNQVPTFDFEIN